MLNTDFRKIKSLNNILSLLLILQQMMIVIAVQLSWCMVLGILGSLPLFVTSSTASLTSENQKYLYSHTASTHWSKISNGGLFSAVRLFGFN